MAFKIAKRYKGNNLELTDSFLIDKDDIVVGRAVSNVSDGVVGTANATTDIVGIITAKYSYPVTDPLGPNSSDQVRCLMTPITSDTLVIADVITAGAANVVRAGFKCGIYDVADANDALGLDATDTSNLNFKVTKVLEYSAATIASKVEGYFITAQN
jgi:hypothetical protein